MEKKRRHIKKEERVLIASKTNFRCGYCGAELKKSYHIDHMFSIMTGGTCDPSNLIASCAPCNLFKAGLSIEQFRREISFQAERGYKNSVNFRTAYRFKQIKITRCDIVFYFEKIGMEK